jgi:hypothetical protein
MLIISAAIPILNHTPPQTNAPPNKTREEGGEEEDSYIPHIHIHY